MSTEDPEDIQVVRTTDEFIYDHLGKRYIDFNSGWCVGNLGWKRKEIQSKINPAKIPDYIAPPAGVQLRYTTRDDVVSP